MPKDEPMDESIIKDAPGSRVKQILRDRATFLSLQILNDRTDPTHFGSFFGTKVAREGLEKPIPPMRQLKDVDQLMEEGAFAAKSVSTKVAGLELIGSDAKLRTLAREPKPAIEVLGKIGERFYFVVPGAEAEGKKKKTKGAATAAETVYQAQRIHADRAQFLKEHAAKLPPSILTPIALITLAEEGKLVTYAVGKGKVGGKPLHQLDSNEQKLAVEEAIVALAQVHTQGYRVGTVGPKSIYFQPGKGEKSGSVTFTNVSGVETVDFAKGGTTLPEHIYILATFKNEGHIDDADIGPLTQMRFAVSPALREEAFNYFTDPFHSMPMVMALKGVGATLKECGTAAAKAHIIRVQMAEGEHRPVRSEEELIQEVEKKVARYIGFIEWLNVSVKKAA